AKSFNLASSDIIAFIDADLSVGPEYLPRMLSMLKDADIVVGSRYLPESQSRRNILRLIFSRTAGAFTRAYFNSKLTDHQCGLKAFRRDVILELVGEAGYDKTLARGFAWDTEILVRAQRKGYRIVEVPVKWTESGRSSVKPLRDWKVIPYTIALKKRL
ncbi:MAG: glycosyltransferase, partial [Candidatus Altiarchaeota archaeon]